MDEKLSRRSFFNLGIQKTTGKIIEKVSRKITDLPRPALRPPGALSEGLFLLNCSKSGECVSACPKQAIQPMTEGTGLYKNTPFIDVFQQACEFCEDFPCISACPSTALQVSQDFPPSAIGTAVVNLEHCLVEQGQICDYCFKSCPVGVDAIRRNARNVPEIDEKACIGCGKCAYICVSQSGKAIQIVPKNPQMEPPRKEEER